MSAASGAGRFRGSPREPSRGGRVLLRVLGALGGAALGSVGLALAEGWRAAGVASVPWLAASAGDVAALAPIASAVGAGVGIASWGLDPRRRWSLRGALADFVSLSGPAAAKMAALALVSPVLALAWVVFVAQAARVSFASGAPAASGFEAAFVSVVGVAGALAAALAAAPWLARHVTGAVAPWVAALCGLTYAVSVFVVGLHLGDTSGNGATPLAILGVLTRPELDLSPVAGVVTLGAAALVGERVSRGARRAWPTAAAIAVGGSWALVVVEAFLLSEAPDVAHAIETGAPLGRLGLALERRLTDRDRDGASALFGGGDCDDMDPRRSPSAIDVPGNGIDEDCSGADLPPPTTPARAAPPPPAAVRNDRNLVLITVDTLRIDLGFMGYPRPVSPSLDALAARSTVFERAYSMASYTGLSVGPTLIGKYPSETLRDGAHFDTYFPENTFLAERLRAVGFRTMGVASHWYFQPRYGLTQGIELWDMTAMPRETTHDLDSSVTSQALTDAAIRLLSDPTNVDRRFFFWGHYFDPHANYVPHPEAPDFRPGARSVSKALYDGEVWFTDHHLGRLFDFIASQPWGQRTVIVVTADHGEAFDEHGMNWHGVDLWEPLVRVPLVVHVPGAAPHRVALKRSLVDLVPTLLDLLGLDAPPPGELSGQSTAPAILAPESSGALDERDVFLDMPAGPQVSLHRALIHGPTPGLKLLSEGGAWFFLFDLSSDPGELHDIAGDRGNRDAFAEMRAAYDQKLATLRTVRVDPPNQAH